MMTSPTIGLSLSAPVHLLQVLGLAWASFGSLSPEIFPESLPPCSYTSTVDSTLPVLSPTVVHGPTGESAASAAPTARSIVTTKVLNRCLIALLPPASRRPAPCTDGSRRRARATRAHHRPAPRR